MSETGSQAQTTLTRTVDGAELPVPGTYAIDTSHSAVEFAVRHLGLAKVRGRFRAFDGVIEIEGRSEESTVTVDVDLASIDTGEPTRDEHLRANDFLDVPNHPTMSFRSTRVTGAGTSWTVEGDLTLRGVTNPVTLAVTFEGAGSDPWGGRRIAFSASGEIDRERWGMTWNQALETGGFIVGRKVRLELEVEAVKQA
ncbi:MAG TPA: YceI family protein [Acidimicrobiales bacterium]|nr:YceI family protein [Acidimicrobiales bacterium]